MNINTVTVAIEKRRSTTHIWVLVQEQNEWIFRDMNEFGSGFSGHYSNRDDAINDIKTYRSITVVSISI